MMSPWWWWIINYYQNLEEIDSLNRKSTEKQVARRKAEEATMQNERHKRRLSTMCSYAQLEVIVEYMEKNGDLAKLTYKGGASEGNRLLAEAGWKEVANMVNTRFGVDKTSLQLRRTWGEFKSRIRKKSVKLQEYKDLPVGKAPAALSELELRVVALDNADEDQASGAADPDSEVGEYSSVRTPENDVKARHHLELPMQHLPIYVKKERKFIADNNSTNGDQNKTELLKIFVKVPPKSPEESITSTVQNTIAKVSAKVDVKTTDTADQPKDNEYQNADVDRTFIVDVDSEHLEMEREFLHLTHLYEQTQKKINENKIKQITETKTKTVEKHVMKNESSDTEATVQTLAKATKRNFTTIFNHIDKENQSPDQSEYEPIGAKKPKGTGNIEDIVSLFMDNIKEQRQCDMKREEKRMEVEKKRIQLEERRLNNEKEALRQRDVQLAQNAQILNVVVQLAELTERVLNKNNGTGNSGGTVN